MPDNSQGFKKKIEKKMEIRSVEYRLHVEFQRIGEKSNNTWKKKKNGFYTQRALRWIWLLVLLRLGYGRGGDRHLK